MANSSNDPKEPNTPSAKNATIWAAVVGLVTAGLVVWILGSQSIIVRLVAGVVSGVAVAISSYRKSAAATSDSGGKSDVEPD